jgi:Asp-tRNA(Asn)/Glu-tRNA(Gln) amidotransferase C subunit
MHKEEASVENELYGLKKYQTKKIEKLKEYTFVNVIVQNSINTLKEIQDYVMTTDKHELEQKYLSQVLTRMINQKSIRRQPAMNCLKDVEILQPSTQSSDQMLLPNLSKDG